ncbi:DUF3744 domain-containing protein [Brachybacterium sp. EF45031]|uniref:ABC transporter ATP-binding protein n=1 Tax=Brachybacterium sillae TaxID=2810536 RepID=UPI00217DF9DB|nr:ABC transporter ATP-binding protein [Brachybacterium sillae]MCS6711429.1 DUF3744 domain-containing protein [Brachybacterium sillae]
MSPAAQRPDDPLIRLEDVTFQYRAQAEPTLHQVSLRIDAGERVAIIGASGSGKSTLLRLINGLVPHRFPGTLQGRVHVAGLDPSRASLVEVSRVAGTVLQDANAQFVGLTVAEDIAFSLENQQVDPAHMPRRVAQAARLVGIDHRLDDPPQALSGGQKQRVAMAGVLVDEVRALLVDEPLAMLDPASGRAAIDLLAQVHAQRGTAVVIVEHRLEDVLHRDVDRVVLMDQGRIVADAPPDEMLASGVLPAHGIRPPLHVEALRHAGQPVTAQQAPRRAETLTLTPAQVEALHHWVTSGPTSPPTVQTPPVAAGLPVSATLELQDVAVDLGGRRVLDGVSASVGRGEIVGLVGSNGAGKSTLARAIAGFVPLAGGRILLDGRDTASEGIAARGRRVGYVLQEPSQMLSQPTVREEVALGLGRNPEEPEAAERIRHALEVCGLLPYRSWPISALSHGQRKRLTIASVLVVGPSVLILDEPTAGQDMRHAAEFMDHVELVAAEGTAVVLVTHDMHLALEYTQRVLVMSGGRLLADAHPARVLTDPELTHAADLVTTGLHTLAVRCGLDPDALVRRQIAADREERA